MNNPFGICFIVLILFSIDAISFSSSSHSSSSSSSLESMFNRAIQESRAGNIEESMRLFKEVISLSKGEYSKLEKKHKEMISLSHNNLGNMQMNSGFQDEAIFHFEEAIMINPTYGLAHNNLGLLYEQIVDEQIQDGFEKVTNHFLQAYESHYTPALSNLKRSINKYESVPSWHFSMLNDLVRNQKFENAILNAIKKRPNGMVLDIGSGSGLLSMMAARGGAKKVIACEQVKAIAQISEKIIHQNGFSQQIHVVPARSSQLQLGGELSEPASIVLAEILDAGLIGEGMLVSLKDARANNLIKSDAIIVPSSATVYAQIIDAPHFLKFPVEMVNGFNLSNFNIFFNGANEYEVSDYKVLQSGDYTSVSDVGEIFKFDLEDATLPDERSKNVEFKIKKKGNYKNLVIAFWFKLYLDQEDNIIDSGPDSVHSHWGQAFQYVGSKHIKEKIVEVKAKHNIGKIFFNLQTK